jgi:hypothetical protein
VGAGQPRQRVRYYDGEPRMPEHGPVQFDQAALVGSARTQGIQCVPGVFDPGGFDQSKYVANGGLIKD